MISIMMFFEILMLQDFIHLNAAIISQYMTQNQYLLQLYEVKQINIFHTNEQSDCAEQKIIETLFSFFSTSLFNTVKTTFGSKTPMNSFKYLVLFQQLLLMVKIPKGRNLIRQFFNINVNNGFSCIVEMMLYQLWNFGIPSIHKTENQNRKYWYRYRP